MPKIEAKPTGRIGRDTSTAERKAAWDAVMRVARQIMEEHKPALEYLARVEEWDAAAYPRCC